MNYFEIAAISRGDIVNVLKSDKHYLENHFKGNNATDIGSLFHDKVLGTNEVKVISLDGFNWRTQIGKREIIDHVEKFLAKDYDGEDDRKDTVSAWIRTNGGFMPTPKELSDIDTWVNSMKSKVYGEGSVLDLFVGGHAEQIFQSVMDKKKVKCMADYYIEDEDMIRVYDLKTIKDVTDKTIKYSTIDHGYDIQAELYSQIMEKRLGKPVEFRFVFIGKAEPTDCGVIMLDEETRENAKVKITEGIKKIKAISGKKNYVPEGLHHDENFNAVTFSSVAEDTDFEY